jgi:hypothetical protein
VTSANFRSLLPGGFYSTPDNQQWHAALRNNNWGAINGASWQRKYPGYVNEVITSYSVVKGQRVPHRTTVVETPEQGVAMWWELMRLYASKGVKTVRQIIKTYGGGQDYSGYEKFVLQRTGLAPDTVIRLDDDAQLLKFAEAMFAYEAGVSEWKTARAQGLKDEQILMGFAIGRNGGKVPAKWPSGKPAGEVSGRKGTPGGLGFSPLRWLLDKLFRR